MWISGGTRIVLRLPFSHLVAGFFSDLIPMASHVAAIPPLTSPNPPQHNRNGLV
jgi:hypothetical protein